MSEVRAAAGRSHLTPEAKGSDPEEPPLARGQGRQLGGATQIQGQGPQPGGANQGVVAVQAQEGLEELEEPPYAGIFKFSFFFLVIDI